MDLIDRQAAITAAKDALLAWSYMQEWRDNKIVESLVDLPSAQPEIIRCKDCKHSFLHNNGERTNRICGRTRMCGTTSDEWYCADAERRKDGIN